MDYTLLYRYFLRIKIYAFRYLYFTPLLSACNTAGNMLLESLPNELLLRIFDYLHRFDLRYTFANLNRRFQEIIKPHLLNDLDLTHNNRPTYRLWKVFCRKVLPLHGQHVRSLKLAGHQQVLLFEPYVRQLVNLESLDIDNNEKKGDFDHVWKLSQFLFEALSIPSLRKLSITHPEGDVFKTIASFPTSHNLSTLTLIYLRGLHNIKEVPSMPNLRRFSVRIASIKVLVQLSTVMPNLEELSLSMLDFADFEHLHLLKVPLTLEKLHLELGCYHCCTSFETTKLFLNAFRVQLRSLTFISVNAEEIFSNFNTFHSLVSNFSRLEIFEYHVRTKHHDDSTSLFRNVEHLPDSSYSFFTRTASPKVRQYFRTINGLTVSLVGSQSRNFILLSYTLGP